MLTYSCNTKGKGDGNECKVILGIKDRNVDGWAIDETSGELLIKLYTKNRKQACIACKQKTKRVHGYRLQKIKGPNLSDRQVQISLRKRRYTLNVVMSFIMSGPETFQMTKKYTHSLQIVIIHFMNDCR
ncbi:transposase family protein [Virgibacillus sp. DJP39]|uniref:transposase family protein n=1 Tax=Virgibacillus sp. DJP39 TaxID=3409790 RepID=UPI003BB6EB8B